MAEQKRNGGRTVGQKRNGNQKSHQAKKIPAAERISLELARVNARITEHTDWLRMLSNDLRRLGDKLYGLTEGRVTLSDAKLPAGRYRTPDQTGLHSSDVVQAAQKMVDVKKRFVKMESDLAAADSLRDQLDKLAARRSRRENGG
jgi:cell wall-associated NlpC family hydrolase